MRLYLIAGEASGDLHGSNLVKALKAESPEARFRGVGGERMAQAGMTLFRDYRATNFMGFSEVVLNLRSILRHFKAVKADILQWQPDAVILIDYPGFNLRMAKWLHQRGIRVFYYISPQLWAWKTGRVRQIRRYVDKMMVILPFEESFYQRYGINAAFVGHPLMDALQPEAIDRRSAREKLGLPSLGKPVVAVLPGSREQEIKTLLPLMMAALQEIQGIEIVVSGAPGQDRSLYEPYLNGATWVEKDTYTLLRAADYAIVTSGTATLETAILDVPEIVVYRGGWLSYWIARQVVGSRIKYISLVNLILDRLAVPELIQKDVNPQQLASELKLLMRDSITYNRMKSNYVELRKRLGEGGASQRAAAIILSALEQPNSIPSPEPAPEPDQ